MWPEHGERAAPHFPRGRLQALLPKAGVALDLCLFMGSHPSWGTRISGGTPPV